MKKSGILGLAAAAAGLYLMKKENRDKVTTAYDSWRGNMADKTKKIPDTEKK
ncbi:MAG: hypothetical protein LIP08_04195 [Bacteroides sp.]|nr:hypothetical protein [Bacteroides sp.]